MTVDGRSEFYETYETDLRSSTALPATAFHRQRHRALAFEVASRLVPGVAVANFIMGLITTPTWVETVPLVGPGCDPRTSLRWRPTPIRRRLRRVSRGVNLLVARRPTRAPTRGPFRPRRRPIVLPAWRLRPPDPTRDRRTRHLSVVTTDRSAGRRPAAAARPFDPGPRAFSVDWILAGFVGAVDVSSINLACIIGRMIRRVRPCIRRAATSGIRRARARAGTLSGAASFHADCSRSLATGAR